MRESGGTSARSAATLRTVATGFRAALLGAVLAVSASAQTIVESFSSFASTSGLSINGNAATATTSDGQVLRLVSATTNQAGSTFTTAQVNVNGFSTAFQFRLTNPGPSSNTDASDQFGADGLTFAIQTVANTALGATGEGLGYQGIGQSSGHSVAVEFDTWMNNIDPSSNHLGVDLNGSITSLSTANVSPNFDNGAIWTAWIDYSGTTNTLEVRVSNTGSRPTNPTLSQTINLATDLGSNSAFVGFTAGTGSDYENHYILDWAYSSTFVSGGINPPLAIPEPDTLALSLVGLVALWCFRRLRPAR